MNSIMILFAQGDNILPIVWTVILVLLLLLAFSIEQVLGRIDRRIAEFQDKQENK